MPGSDLALRGYAGRFAPSPSGPLHDGSLVAAMASYLDARTHRGRWLLRIEDIDTPRVVAGADKVIMSQLQALGMQWDGEPVWQSRRHAMYQSAFDTLMARQQVYGCCCTRQEISTALARHVLGQKDLTTHDLDPHYGRALIPPERPYPGTCRAGIPKGRAIRAWRFKVSAGIERFQDRWLGVQQQDVARDVGDFILKRADGLWAYQLAVVVDDNEQGITDIVRGADLLGSTARQRILARHLDIRYPNVMHVPIVRDDLGNKLSKQNHAPSLDSARAVQTLDAAWRRLGFPALEAADVPSFWRAALPQWAARFNV